MQSHNTRGPIVFAELELDGQRIVCPHCLVPFIPHLGNMIATKFQCENCKNYLSYRDGTIVRCPCCNFRRPAPNVLLTLVCEGCGVTIIYDKCVITVNCPICKCVTRPPVSNVPVRAADRVYRPRINQIAAPVEVESTASTSLAPKPESSNTHEDEDKTETEETESKKIRRL